MGKARYSIGYSFDNNCHFIIDNYSLKKYTRDIVDLLNQQDARIKELEEENGYIIFADGYDDNGNKVSEQVYTTYKSKCDELKQENQQLKEQLEDKRNTIQSLLELQTMLESSCSYQMFLDCQDQIKQLKQSQNEKENEILQKVVDFINELAWDDVKYDAFQSTMGEFPASPSAIPRYAKKYFDLWKEMFNENLEEKNKKLGVK